MIPLQPYFSRTAIFSAYRFSNYAAWANACALFYCNSRDQLWVERAGGRTDVLAGALLYSEPDNCPRLSSGGWLHYRDARWWRIKMPSIKC